MKLPSFPVCRLGAGFAALLLVQAHLPQAKADPPPGSPATLSPLDQLTGPIALYPDPLLALILPASTVPSDIASAARYLGGNDDPSQIDSQPWDPSVRGLAHYPNVLEWMAQNLDWTVALGTAFTNQPADVMNSIQKLRAIARAAGTLVNTPQLDVVDEAGAIAIVPEDPQMIYVPSYDPAVVYVTTPYYGNGGPWITFGIGFPVGAWLAYDFNWQGHAIWHGDWRNWHNASGWGHPVFPGQRGYINAANSRQWQPSANARRAQYSSPQRATAARPQPMVDAPRPPELRASEVGRRAGPGGAEQRRAPAAPGPAGQYRTAPQDASHRAAAPTRPKPAPPPVRRAPPPSDDKKPDK